MRLVGSSYRRWAGIIGIVVCLLASVACSEDESPLNFDLQCLDFVPAGSVADDTVVARVASTSTCSFLDIELVATGVSDVLGARFTLSYPFTFAQLDGVDVTTSFLGSDGTSLIVEVEPETPPDGIVAIVITRQGTTGATPVPDTDEILATLNFTQTSGVGLGALIFSLTSLEAPGTPPTPVGNVVWFGGELSIE